MYHIATRFHPHDIPWQWQSDSELLHVPSFRHKDPISDVIPAVVHSRCPSAKGNDCACRCNLLNLCTDHFAHGKFRIEVWTLVVAMGAKYRGVNKGLFVLLSRTQAGPGRTVKQEQEEISRNHVQTFIHPSVQGDSSQFYTGFVTFCHKRCCGLN